MKAPTKTKNTPKRKTSQRASKTSRKVILVHAKTPGLRHFRLVSHKHTGKLIHHSHTSHLALAVILALVGFLLYASSSFAAALTLTSSRSLTVGAVVPGPAPTIGAVITSPTNGQVITNQNTVEVRGTCAAETFVVVKDNDSIVGSTNCTTAGIFNLIIQIQKGTNVLSALNYDAINQSGPNTPVVIINAVINNSPVEEVVVPVLPNNPSVVPVVNNPDLSDCSKYKPSSVAVGGQPHVAIVCVPRLFSPGLQQTIGILVWGGTPPYAVNINWGDQSADKLLSLSNSGYKTLTFKYTTAGIYKVTFNLTDKNDNKGFVQTSVQINGEIQSVVPGITNDIIEAPWFKTPVPLYLVTVAITLGFWGGDIFNRKFGVIVKHSRRTRRTA